MKSVGLVMLVIVAVFAGAGETVAQVAGSTLKAVSTSELREVAKGWSVKKQLLGKDVYNGAGEKIGEIEDIIVAPNSVRVLRDRRGGRLSRGRYSRRRGDRREIQAAGWTTRPARRHQGGAEGDPQVRVREELDPVVRSGVRARPRGSEGGAPFLLLVLDRDGDHPAAGDGLDAPAPPGALDPGADRRVRS
jgi:PRC-barrel domain